MNSALKSLEKVSLLDGVLLLPHRSVKSMGGCLATRAASSRLTVAVNLLIAGGSVLSLLRLLCWLSFGFFIFFITNVGVFV